MDVEMSTFFPETGNSAKLNTRYGLLKKRTIKLLEKIQGIVDDKDFQQTDVEFFSQFKPQNFAGKNGIELKMIRSFENACIFLTQSNIAFNPKEMTVLSFFQAIEKLKEQNDKAKKKK